MEIDCNVQKKSTQGEVIYYRNYSKVYRKTEGDLKKYITLNKVNFKTNFTQLSL